ncbi:MAG TPA: ATP-binding protein, partial [Clostridia bacterium]|nr:ATP-binding protein [Clostridia bacterium]
LICFTVRDNGKGMTRQQLNSIWENGYSTRNSNGLGLSFVKKVVTDCGGFIDIESKPDSGTTVTLMMPEGECSNGQ